jgi:ketosteroid isomerase-like protein
LQDFLSEKNKMAPIRMERVEAGIRSVIAFTEALNRHDFSGILKLFSEDCVFEAPTPAPDGAIYKGKNAIAQYWKDFFDRTPDACLQIEETIGFGLRCIALWRCDWTDTSGTRCRLRGVDLFRVRDGLIVEQISYIKG